MTVKAKPLSQQRAEEKRRKLLKKQKRAIEAAKQQNDVPQSRGLAPQVAHLQARVANGDFIKLKNTMTFEDRVVDGVHQLDVTLADLFTTFDMFAEIRTTLKWEALRGKYDEATQETIEALIVHLEEGNKLSRKELEDAFVIINGQLDDFKKAPTPELFQAWSDYTNAVCIESFNRWNERSIEPYSKLQDIIDALED